MLRPILVLPWRAFRWATRRAIYQMLASDPKFSAKIGAPGNGNAVQKRPAPPVKTSAAAPSPPAPSPPAPSTTPAPATPAPGSSSASVKLRAKIHTAIKRSPAPSVSLQQGENFGVSDNPDTPLVTVAIALYNEPKFIADAIESVKRQTFQNFEAIVVDDCSTDNSRAALKKAIGTDARFRVVQHLKNTGVNGARNTAIRLARAPLIAFLDADDFFLPDSLELRLNSFLDNCDDHVAGVFSGIAHAPENVTFNYVPPNRKWSKAAQTFLSAEGDCPFNMHAPLLRTDVLKKMGGFDEGLRDGAEDWDMWQRVMRHGYVFLPVPIVTAVYRARPGSRVREFALEHTRLGANIFNWAYSPLPEREVIPGTPHVFMKGLGDYRQKLVFLPRALQFGAMSFMNSAEQFAGFLKEFPIEIWPYAKYQLDYKLHIKKGVARYLASDAATLKSLDGAINQATDTIYAHFEAAAMASEAASQRTECSQEKPKSVAMFPHGLAQAKIMAALREDLARDGAHVRLVSTETLSGDQGAEDYYKANGIPYETYSTFAFAEERRPAAVSVVMRPYSGYIRETIEAKLIVEIENSHGVNDQPEANKPAIPASVVTVEQAAAAIRTLLEAQAPTQPITKQCNLSTPGIIVGVEELADRPPDYEKIVSFQNRYRGERCFIIGNGPSINNTDLRKLKDEFTFAVNGIFYKTDEMGFDPTFYVVSDSSVMKENTEAIRAYKAGYKFFPTLYRSLHPAEPNVAFYLLNRGFYEKNGQNFCVPRFSMDPARRIYCGQSVTLTNIQLAYYMGFKEVYMIGMDFTYTIPPSAIVQGELITSTEDDPNHFHKDYFGAGKTWKDPHLDRIQIGYQYARDIFQADGREIVNATKGGALEVFRRVDYDSLF